MNCLIIGAPEGAPYMPSSKGFRHSLFGPANAVPRVLEKKTVL
jgi:hypothetical protein